MAQAEQIPGTECYHGEGPCWADEWGGLRWVDMLSGDVLSLDQHGGVTRTHVGEVAAVIRPRASGGAVLALKDSFAVTDGDLGQLRTVATVRLEPGVRLNEGGCDPDGRFYCGSMATDESPQAGTFYCLDPDGSVRPVLDKVTISNGFDFSPDGTIAYYVDTRDQSIDIFDYSADTGLVNRRRWVDVPVEAGWPDGLTVDAEGGVWLALMGGSAVHHYSASGRLEEVITAAGIPGHRLHVRRNRPGHALRHHLTDRGRYPGAAGLGGAVCGPARRPWPPGPHVRGLSC